MCFIASLIRIKAAAQEAGYTSLNQKGVKQKIIVHVLLVSVHGDVTPRADTFAAVSGSAGPGAGRRVAPRRAPSLAAGRVAVALAACSSPGPT